MRTIYTYAVALCLLFCGTNYAQNTDSLKQQRFSIHMQTTVITQFKPSFHAPYSGANSLVSQKENKTSLTTTLFLGARLWKGASLSLNPELAGGSGLSGALGIAAAANGETFRVGNPAPQIYLARLFFTQKFALGKEREFLADDFNQIAEYSPKQYIGLTVGKISISDFFDRNTYSHDPRTQFMSWALMSNGAWDYPANTRGYTPSVVLEYVSPKHELRYGLSLLPNTANGSNMTWDISKACSQTLEYTYNYSVKDHPGAIRVLGFYTIANMGNYRQSLAMGLQTPDITLTRKFSRSKFGFAVNAEQAFTNSLGGFFRASWNDGNNETWVFTEIDRSVSLGLVLNGTRWKRADDNVGFAYVASGLSKPHRDYLQAGGRGFILGDGNLTYSWEHMLEFYYKAPLIKDHLYLSAAYQLLVNPGYNTDRQGPVNIFSIRVHARI